MIDAFMAELDRRLRLPRRARARVLEDVRDHLDDAITAGCAGGLDSASATERAVLAFGSPGDLADQLNAQSATATMRRTPIVLAACGAAVVGGFVPAATRNPPQAATTAPAVVQVAFFVAMLGSQVALVSGARAASLVAARWRSEIAPASERELVRTSGVIGVGALATAAAGWSVAVVGAFARGHASRPVAVVVGTLVMLGAATVAVATLARRTGADGNVPQFQSSGENSRLLTFGEHAIEQIRRHPVLACSAAAIVGALGVMSHAESTVSSRGDLGCHGSDRRGGRLPCSRPAAAGCTRPLVTRPSPSHHSSERVWSVDY